MSYFSIIEILKFCARRSEKTHLMLGEVLDSLERSSFCLVCILLALPFLQPIPLGPVAMASGLTFAAMGWQLFRGDSHPWLPRKMRLWGMSSKTWQKFLNFCVRLLAFCRKFTRPRYQSWVTGEKGRKIGGFIITISGLLMALPLVMIPLNNTLPAWAIFFVCVADLEEDGLMIFVALFFLLLTVLYFVTACLFFWVFGNEIIEFLGFYNWDWLSKPFRND